MMENIIDVMQTEVCTGLLSERMNNGDELALSLVRETANCCRKNNYIGEA